MGGRVLGGSNRSYAGSRHPAREQLRLRPSLSAPREARQRVAASCRDLGPEVTDHAVLLTSELVTNAVLHGARGFRRGVEILLDIHRTDELLRVEVRDHDARPVPHVRFLAPLASQSGRGLDVVAVLASAWGSDRVPAGEGKVVWFELRIAEPADGRSGTRQ